MRYIAFNLTFCIFITWTCLNTVHAQTEPSQGVLPASGGSTTGPTTGTSGGSSTGTTGSGLGSPNSIPSPLPQIRAIETNTQNAPGGAVVPATGTQLPPTKAGKYSEYQSYCRSNIYDPGFEYSRYLSSDVAVVEVKKMIDSKKYNDAEKYVLSHRQSLGEQNYYQSIILINGLKRNFTEAFSWIDRSSAEHKNDFSLKRLAALVYELQNNFMEAKMMVQDLYKDTKNVAVLEDLCRLNALDSQHRDAEISCDTAGKKLPTNFLVPIWLGVSYREREMYKEAKAEFEKSLEILKSEFALTCLAEIEYLRTNKTEALKYFTKAVEFNPRSIRAQIGTAKLYFEQNNFEKALEHYISSCQFGRKDRTEFRKAYKELTLQKNPIAEKYITAIQNCP